MLFNFVSFRIIGLQYNFENVVDENFALRNREEYTRNICTYTTSKNFETRENLFFDLQQNAGIIVK